MSDDNQVHKIVLKRTYCVTGFIRHDGGVVEVSTDNGRTWAKFNSEMLVSAIPVNEDGKEKM